MLKIASPDSETEYIKINTLEKDINSTYPAITFVLVRNYGDATSWISDPDPVEKLTKSKAVS